MSVPAYWEKLSQLALAGGGDRQAQLERLRQLTGGRLSFCLSGGAGLAREVKEMFLEAGMLIIEGYGLTEASPNLSFNRHDDFDFNTVGKPVPSVEIRLAEDGEILARGPNIFSGYFKDPDSTREVLDADGWLHTGDLGQFTERGFLQIIGRKKEIIVTSGGKNIPPANIEGRFKDEPLIAHVMVYGDGKRYLTALVDIDDAVASARLGLEEGSGADSEQLRRHPEVQEWIQQCIDAANSELAKFETIKRFAVASEPLTVEAGMLTPTLKLRRKNIIDRYQAELEALYA
jgi:long-chain acyl-CoA synthetase